jgi:hypothetical protein
MLSLVTLLHGSSHSNGVLQSAMALRGGLDAELVVVHPDPGADLPTVVGGYEGYVPLVDADAVEKASSQARHAFDSVCAGSPRCTFRATKTSSHETMRKHTMFADLCILARDPGLMGDDFGMLKAALVSYQIPTVLLPDEPLKGAPETVVFSWNGQPPSARAIRAALPFVKTAKRFLVLEHAGNEVNFSRMERFFARNGVKPSEWRPYGDSSLTARGRARALLAEAKAENCDLLVMGAYGDRAEKYFSFGRATDKVASAARIPVLFSS